MAKMITEPVIRTLKFMVVGVTGVATGKKLKIKMMIPKHTAKMLTAIPKIPGRWNGP